MEEIAKTIAALLSGSLGTVIVYLRVIGSRMDKIDGKLEKINGSVRSHEVRLAVLEDK